MQRPIRLLCSTVVAVLVAGAVLVGVDEQAQAAFPGKNGRIAFTRFPEIGDAEIYKMFPDGSAQKQVTYNSTNDVRPAWSPDGTKIAFTNGEASDIFVINANGGGQVNLTKTPGISDDEPAWSPNGRKIVFTSDGDLWIMEADGTNRRNFTNTPEASEFGPDWQPVTAALG
jgi:Tol biopolymer transport system component